MHNDITVKNYYFYLTDISFSSVLSQNQESEAGFTVFFVMADADCYFDDCGTFSGIAL